MTTIAYDRYYRFDEFTAILKGWAQAHPELLTLESIGKSHEAATSGC